MLTISELLIHLESLAEVVFNRLESEKLLATSLTVKVKFSNFEQVTRTVTLSHVLDISEAKTLLPDLLAKTEAGKHAVRLVGVTAGGFIGEAAEQAQQLQFSLD